MTKKYFEKSVNRIVRSNGDFDILLKKMNYCTNYRLNKIKQPNYVLVICASLCALIVCVGTTIGIISINQFKTINNASSNISINVSSSNTTTIPDFNTLKTYEKFRIFSFGEFKYASYDGVLGYIDSDLIDEKIGEIDLKTTDQFQTTVENEHAIIYKIKNISQDYKIAVKFSKESGCFLYYSFYVKDQISLDDFLLNSGLSTYASFDEATYSYSLEGEGVARQKTIKNIEEDIKNLFDKNKNITNVYSSDYFSPYNHFTSSISIKIVTNRLGGTISHLSINDDGRARFKSSGNNTFLFDVSDVAKLKNKIINSL